MISVICLLVGIFVLSCIGDRIIFIPLSKVMYKIGEWILSRRFRRV